MRKQTPSKAMSIKAIDFFKIHHYLEEMAANCLQDLCHKISAHLFLCYFSSKYRI